MKNICFLAIILLFSCSPAKIKDFDKDYTQNLVGKIKSMTVKNYEYRFLNRDTVLLVKTRILNYDKDNNIINEKINTEDETLEIVYSYNGNLKVSEKEVPEKNNAITNYKYDDLGNLMEQKSFDDKRVLALFTYKYDKYNNPIEKKLSFFGKNNGIITTEYDYKKRFFIASTVIDSMNLSYSQKKYFNKKGYVIKYQPVENVSKYHTYEIDKKGNLTKKIYYKNDNSIIETVTYKNSYDKKGNIIVRERYLNNKLLEKTTYDIIY